MVQVVQVVQAFFFTVKEKADFRKGRERAGAVLEPAQ